ncbi:MAG: CopD family protein [Zoogloeaceae bacterium]|nr:CopD family protein [Zoogloeaceae bacterium]
MQAPEFLVEGYNILKFLHICLIVSWFAGLFYLPRIFVNLAMVPEGSDAEYARLIRMSQKLYRFMTPLGMLAIIIGLLAWWDLWSARDGWLHLKTLFTVLLVIYNFHCGHLIRVFEAKKNTHSHVWYRFYNEIPTIAMFVCIYYAVVKTL